jgi:hypothetical protein
VPGTVVNLSVPGYRQADLVVVDTNLLIERLIVTYLGAAPMSARAIVNARRTDQLFQEIRAAIGTAIVTPTAFNEFIHLAIKTKYDQERRRLGPSARPTYGRPDNSLLDLYKRDATILRAFFPDLRILRQLLATSGLWS